MPKITEMFAFIAEDAGPDDEGIPAEFMQGAWMPLVGADMARMESLRPVARRLAAALGKPIKLVKFSTRTEIEEIG